MKGNNPPLAAEGRPSAASHNEVPAVMGRVNLCAQHHTVLSLERSLSICGVFTLFRFCFGRQLCQGLYCCGAYNVLCATSGSQPTIVSACFSMLHTHTIVVLDTAWPWASEAYGLCRLCAYFCAHKLIRARSYCLIVLQIVASSMLQSQ